MTQKGFSLVEMIVATAVGVITLLLLAMIFIKGLETYGALKAEANIRHATRRAIYQLASEIRRARIASVNIPTPDQISFELPVFQIGPGDCSAFATNPATTTLVACSGNDTTTCVNSCGINLTWACRNDVCHKLYSYSLTAVGSTKQLVCATQGEGTRILATGLQSITFKDSVSDTALKSNEIRIQLSGQELSDYEKRSRQETLQTVVQVKN